MGTTRHLFQRDGIRVSEHECEYGPDDRPFEELHCGTNVAFVVAGAFDIRAPEGSAALGPGSIILGNEGAPYTCVHDAGRGDVCVSFGFSRAVVEEAASSLGLRPSFRGISLGPSPSFAAAPAMARASPVALEEAALELLGGVLAADSDRIRNPRRPAPAEERRAVEALRHIEAHASEPLPLSALAERARLTRFHFLRSFRAAVGTTPHQSILAARLRRAAKLLLETRLPVTDIAFEAGFGDLSNFIRTFRRATGRSPRAFRQGLSA